MDLEVALSGGSCSASCDSWGGVDVERSNGCCNSFRCGGMAGWAAGSRSAGRAERSGVGAVGRDVRGDEGRVEAV